LDADWIALERWELFLLIFVSSDLSKVEIERIKLQYANTCLNKRKKHRILVEVGGR
jgi:hypothetical protein